MSVAYVLEEAREIAAHPGGGHLLLQMLSIEGWHISETTDGMGGVRVVAEHVFYGRVEARGASAAAVVCDILQDAILLKTRGPAQ